VIDKLVKNKVTDENKIATTLTEAELEVLMQDLDNVDSNEGFLNCIDEAGTKMGANVALMEKAKGEHANQEAFDKALETEMMKQMSSLKNCSIFFYFFLLASKE
jgi:oligoribonuclease (3'-5' exoribonuclease)